MKIPMRLAVFASLGLISSLVTVGCSASTGSTSTGAEGADSISIAYSVEALDPTQTEIAAQIGLRAHELSTEQRTISADIFSADNDVSRQNSDIEAITTRGTDGLIVSCVDPKGCVSAVESAHDAGVVVVDVRGNLPTEKVDVVYQGLDEKRIGELVYEQAKEYLATNPDENLKYGLIMGGATFTQTHQRVQAIRQLAEEMPERVEILVEDYGDWTTDGATTLMEDWSIRYPDLNALALSSDEMALGAVNVLKEQGTLDDFYILSVNASENGLRMIRSGAIAGTVGIKFAVYGANMVDAAVKSIDGELEPGATYDVSDEVLEVVTTANVDAYESEANVAQAAAEPYLP